MKGRRLNIVFSATRQFNPGDEFILYGIMNLLHDVMENESFNAVIYNRNPDINQRFDSVFTRTSFNRRKFRGASYAASVFRIFRWDNSIRKDSDWKKVDLIVFAGSPEWYGARSRIVYWAAKRYKIPVIYMGIGTGEENIEKKIKEHEWKVIDRALYITTRDKMTTDMLCLHASETEERNRKGQKWCARPKCVVCPSICSSRTQKRVEKVRRIALIYSSSRVSDNNNISVEAEHYIKRLYAVLMKKYDTALVCHYIEELDYAVQDFPGEEYYYSFDSHDYFDIYAQFDFVIGCRVHGIGICASMGIPGIIINHSIRCETGKLLGAGMVTPDLNRLEETVEYIEDCIRNAAVKSMALSQLKKETWNTYVSDLKCILGLAGIWKKDSKEGDINMDEIIRGGIPLSKIFLPDRRREVLYG